MNDKPLSEIIAEAEKLSKLTDKKKPSSSSEDDQKERYKKHPENYKKDRDGRQTIVL